MKLSKPSRNKAPTGDPNIPFAILKTKATRLLIVEKLRSMREEGATGSEEECFTAEE